MQLATDLGEGFQTLPNSSTDSSILAITVDQVGDVIVAGYFSGETDFGGTSINVQMLRFSSPNSTALTVHSSGSSAEVASAISRSPTWWLTMQGTFSSPASLRINVLFGTNSYNIVGTQDSFVVKVSSTGAFLLTGYDESPFRSPPWPWTGTVTSTQGVPMKERWPRTDGPSRPTKAAQICSSSRKVRPPSNCGLPRVAAMQLSWPAGHGRQFKRGTCVYLLLPRRDLQRRDQINHWKCWQQLDFNT